MGLREALDAIVNEMNEVPGIQLAPKDPPEKSEVYPFAVVFPIAGTYEHLYGGENMKGLHDVVIEVHVQRRDLPKDYRRLVDLIDRVPQELMEAQKNGKFTIASNLSTWQSIAYEFGPSSYYGVATLAITYTLEGVKVETAV